MINSLDKSETVKNFVAAAAYLKTHTMSTGKVGVVGFCWGGAMANQLAVHSEEVTAAVPYYGRQPDEKDVPKIQASLLLQYAGLDERINAGIPAFEAALKKAGVDYTLYMYPGAKHAFNNDTNPERYNPEAAQLAWQRTMAFFSEKLRNNPSDHLRGSIFCICARCRRGREQLRPGLGGAAPAFSVFDEGGCFQTVCAGDRADNWATNGPQWVKKRL